MTPNDIKDIFADIESDTLDVIVRDIKLKPLLVSALDAINTSTPRGTIVPAPKDMFAAFRYTPMREIKVVLLGQDPYSGGSTGLSFDSPSITPSLKNIYAAQSHSGLVDLAQQSVCTDLSVWAKRGVLLLNCALTTQFGITGAHVKIWRAYINALIATLSVKIPHAVFILLGAQACGKRVLIDGTKHAILTWGHPSGQNFDNNTDNPKHFKYCTAFAAAGEHLAQWGLTPVDWRLYTISNDTTNDTTNDIIEFTDNITDDQFAITVRNNLAQYNPSSCVCFCDGGASNNGTPQCVASYAFAYINNGVTAAGSGIVASPPTPSNNRGELTAISCAINSMIANNITKATLYTDSNYCVLTLAVYCLSWRNNPKLARGKKNLDLVMPIRDLLDKHEIKLIHCAAHRSRPVGASSTDMMIWTGNMLVDAECTRQLQG